MSFNSFTELEVWKKSREFRNKCFNICKSFPKDEKYSLKSQLTRSSRSITANIAEGFGRFHHQENIQFCRIARGSLFESLDHLISAFDCKYITEEKLMELKKQVDEVLKLLNGYIKYLKTAKTNNLKTK